MIAFVPFRSSIRGQSEQRQREVRHVIQLLEQRIHVACRSLLVGDTQSEEGGIVIREGTDIASFQASSSSQTTRSTRLPDPREEESRQGGKQVFCHGLARMFHKHSRETRRRQGIEEENHNSEIERLDITECLLHRRLDLVCTPPLALPR